MAIVKAPAFSFEASGNCGNINFTRWRGRQVARARYYAAIPNTPKQVGIQQYLETAVYNWRMVLTTAYRDAWIEYARTQWVTDRLGNQRHPSGYNLYVGRQIQAYRVGAGLLSWPPDEIMDRAATEIEAESGPADSQFRVRLAGEAGDLVVWNREYWVAGPYDSEARYATSDEWRFEAYRGEDVWLVVAGVASKWYWVRGRLATYDGRVTNWIQGHVRAQPLTP